jgi:anaerobic selenocysteine-containing dehydrogenase
MFGTMLSVPIPDVDRCDHLLMLGANPLVSNGSLLTAPNMRGRLRAIRERGGKVVVIDPRRTRTAEEADEHHFIRPGTDALLLAAIACTLVEEGLDDPDSLAGHANGLEEVRELVREFSPEDVAGACGIPAVEIRRMARELAAAERAAVYGRIGTCTQELGTHASWLVDVLNVLTGNLDREGGAMFTRAAGAQRNTAGKPGVGKGVKLGRWQSRVRGLPEAFGELPVVCLAEEIETPGEGQIRALVTVAGNPVVSTPQSERLDRALSELDFMVSLDIYVNETTRHADVILPGPSPLARSHYDLALYQLAVRNVANYSAPAMEPEPDLEPEWRQLLRLTAIVTGQGAEADLDAIDSFVIDTLIQRAVADPQSPLAGRDPAEVREELGDRRGPDRALDLFLRAGPYALTLDELERNPHGIDLGALAPRVPEVLRRRRRPAARITRTHAQRPPRPDRPAPAALEQLLDAQPAPAREGQGPLHHAREPGGRGTPGPDRRRASPPHVRDRLDRGAGRGDRRDPRGRRLDPARLGPRRAGRPARSGA